MHWAVTISWLVISVGLAVLSNWQAGRPPKDDLTPRMIPWRIIMLLAAFSAVLSLVHMANLFGIQTGPEHTPFRRGFG